MTLVLRRTSSSERSNKFEERRRLRIRGKYFQMDAQRREILGETGSGAGIVALQLPNQTSELLFTSFWVGRLVQGFPVGVVHAFVQLRLLGQLGHHVTELVDRAPLAIGFWPQLLDGPDQPRCTVADRQHAWTEPAPDEIPP